MLTKKEFENARAQRMIDIVPWPADISPNGQIALHLANDIVLKPAVQGEEVIPVEIQTAETISVHREAELIGHIQDELSSGLMRGMSPRKLEATIVSANPFAPTFNGPIRLQITYSGQQPKSLCKGQKIVTIWFDRA